ncbi:glycosyltransferase [Flavobacterium granuli]|uniref:Glycosyltransferase involved in cell wall biosynthesis n=1 Tax=Flavobacterium granuli TaxID=280093 RepID=A0ABU1RYE2_9FLAO|nr:glycosyltransferase [Flavobacterium granuli]MDR6843776.1 glycosyltransferase involved in cell wall biosynthesis [Flavobacterium granuli]
MQNNPLVTIICLCYNHEAYVVESLNSVINQSYPFIELIIVDDFSIDSSKTIIRTWLEKNPQIQFITNETNLGNTKSFNKALKIAKGEYIIDLAADDILLPNCVTLQLEGFKNSHHKNLGVVYGNVELISENGVFESYYFPVNDQKKIIENRITGDIYQSVLSGGNSICSVSAIIKKTVFDHLQGYDETLAYEDLDFWIRASRQYEFDFIDEPLVQKRTVTNSLGSDFFKKKDSRAKKINHSTYLILKKAIELNRTRNEDLAIQKRIHNEIIHTLKINDFGLFLKLIGLRVLLIKRKFFKN